MGEPERFEKPEPELKAEEFQVKASELEQAVPLLDSEDLSKQMTLSYDAFAADKDYFYNYSALRGLTRAIKGPLGNWKHVDKINEELKGLKSVSMVVHDGKLLVRHEGLTDTPFVIFDKETLKPVEPTDETKFKHPEGDSEEDKRKKLDWSDQKMPKEDEEDEEEKKSEEEKEEEERKRPRRKMGASPLASDGKYIYALSMVIKEEDKDQPYSCEKIMAEQYEIKEGNIVEQTNSYTLKKDSDTDWGWKRTKYNTEGGLFDHA